LNLQPRTVRGEESIMKAFFFLAPLAAAALAGCSYYTTPAPAPVAVVAPTYTTPPNAVVLGAPAATLPWAQLDSDGDGYAKSVDRFPYDATRH
jgi:hypothetical protein